MGYIFINIFEGFMAKIEENRQKFENFDKKNIGKSASMIFNTYWDLDGMTNVHEGENKEIIRIKTKSDYEHLPLDLRNLVK